MKRTKITQYSVSDFISWYKAGNLELSPYFQRRAVWRKGAKSYLIDTIINELPIPIIFLRERKSSLDELEPKREVVDGQQRLRTLISFIAPKTLKDFNPDRDEFIIIPAHNAKLAGKKYSELPSEVQQSILDYEFSVHVLPHQMDDREMLQIFSRMNSTGMKLNPQELRNAGYFGEFKTSMLDLSSEQLTRWRSWKIFSEDNLARMEEVEITSEFAILMLKGLTGKSQSMINNTYAEKDDKFPGRHIVEKRFRAVMEVIDEFYGESITKTVFYKKTLFFMLFAKIYDLLFKIGSDLKADKARPIKEREINKIKEKGENIKKGIAPKEVLNACTRRTTNYKSRSTILKYLN